MASLTGSPRAYTLNLVQQNAKRRNNYQCLPALSDGNTGPEKVLSNRAFLLRISKHRAEGRKWDGPEQQTSFDLGWGSLIWEDKGEAGHGWSEEGARSCNSLGCLQVSVPCATRTHCSTFMIPWAWAGCWRSISTVYFTIRQSPPSKQMCLQLSPLIVSYWLNPRKHGVISLTQQNPIGLRAVCKSYLYTEIFTWFSSQLSYAYPRATAYFHIPYIANCEPQTACRF